MLAEVFPMGSWKNVIEMEDHLTLDELYLLLESKRKGEHEERRFLAAMQGVDIEEGTKEVSDFDRVKQQVAADAAGMSEEAYFFDMVGFGFETDDDED